MSSSTSFLAESIITERTLNLRNAHVEKQNRNQRKQISSEQNVARFL